MRSCLANPALDFATVWPKRHKRTEYMCKIFFMETASPLDIDIPVVYIRTVILIPTYTTGERKSMVKWNVIYPKIAAKFGCSVDTVRSIHIGRRGATTELGKKIQAELERTESRVKKFVREVAA